MVLDVRHSLDTPTEGDDILTAADQWLTTLDYQETNANQIVFQLEKMIKTREN